MAKYKIVQNSKDKRWYVVGYCGGGYWMSITDGFQTKEEAFKLQKKQYVINHDAIKYVGSI